MAGHSQFKNIMYRKGAQDAKKAKIFTKITREIISAVKAGLPDPASNPRLRSAIQWAREENMPRDRIEAAIKRGSGNVDADNFENMRYEGYGPGGTAIIVQALTDNRRRWWWRRGFLLFSYRRWRRRWWRRSFFLFSYRR